MVDERVVNFRARASWLCPVGAWASQFVLVMTLRRVQGIAMVWLIAAVTQLVLIVLGIYFGVRVLSLGRGQISSANRQSAITGITLSSATVLLVCVMVVAGL